MQIISSPETPPLIIDDYLHNSDPLVICAEPGVQEIDLHTPTDRMTGDGAPFLLTFDEAGGYTAYITLIPAQIVTRDGGLRLHLAEGVDQIAPVAAIARASEPQQAIHRAVQKALKLTGNLGKPPLPGWLDQFGWASTGETSHEQVLTALDSLPYQPGHVLLRNGWQGAFPSGLSGLAAALRERGIPHLGLEHQTMGQTGDNLGDTFQFFYNFYAKLKGQGVTFVEADHGQPALSRRNIGVAIQAAASSQFNWTTSPLAPTSGTWEAHLREGVWLQHLMIPIPPPPTDERTAILNALSGATFLVEGNGAHLDKLLLPSGRILKANSPLTLTDDSLFNKGPNLKGFTYKAGCGIVATFGREGSVSPDDFGGRGSFALHSYRKGYMGLVETAIAVTEPDIFTFAPIVDGIGLLGHPKFFLTPGPIQEMRHDEERIHISSQVTAPLLLYSARDVLEIRCNGKVVPWGHDKQSGQLMICEGRPLIEQPSLYTISLEN